MNLGRDRTGLAGLLASAVPPSTRYQLREYAGRLKELAYRLRFWQWRFQRIRCAELTTGDVLFIGTGRSLDRVVDLIGHPCGSRDGEFMWGNISSSVLASDFPTPGAYRVPVMLNTVVPLGRTLEEVSSDFRHSLRRMIRAQRDRYSTREVVGDGEIEAIDRTMLQPFASARHGSKVNQLGADLVRQFARSRTGRLDVLSMDGQPVGCCVSSSFVRDGKRYWNAVRFGYPEAVFSDGCLLRKTNAMMAHLALERAIEGGFDFFNIGLSMAQPDGGLLQWKKHRAGVLDARDYLGLVYLRVPESVAPEYLWKAPLFALEKHGLALHLGVPADATEEAILERYREMNYRGLSRICLHGAGAPRESVAEAIRGLFKPHDCPPVVFAD